MSGHKTAADTFARNHSFVAGRWIDSQQSLLRWLDVEISGGGKNIAEMKLRGTHFAGRDNQKHADDRGEIPRKNATGACETSDWERS